MSEPPSERTEWNDNVGHELHKSASADKWDPTAVEHTKGLIIVLLADLSLISLAIKSASPLNMLSYDHNALFRPSPTAHTA